MSVTRKVLGSDYADTLLQVRRACSYITDDAKIAQFFGVTKELVQGERCKLPKKLPVSHNWSSARDGHSYSNDGAVRENIAMASSKLNALCWRLYEREGEKRGRAPLEVAVQMGMQA